MKLELLISADSHTLEPGDLWLGPMSKEFGDRTPRVVPSYQGQEGPFFFTGAQYARFLEQEQKARDAGTPRAGFDPAERVRFQQKTGIHAEVLYPTLGLSILHASNQPGYRPVVRAAATVYNDWLAELVAHDPKRLVGSPMIPLDDVAWAVSELERTTRKGLNTPLIHAQPPKDCPPYRDTVYDPFWAAAEESGLPVTLHIITGRIPDPLACHSKEEWEEAPNMFLDTWEEIPHVLASDFIFGGILDRFPRLKLVTAELELSWIPNFLRRIDMIQGVYSNRLQLKSLQMKASDYLRSRVWHGIIDEKSGLAAIEELGADQVVWGSDFPHTISLGAETRQTLAELFQDLTPPDPQKITALNAARLFGIDA